MSKVTNCFFCIKGNNNKIVIGNECSLSGARFLIIGNGCSIVLSNNVIINASEKQPTIINAINSDVSVGQGSLFSNNIEIHTSDYHGIYDEDGNRINGEKGIIIGEHVWIGLGSKILKGVSLGPNTIVGAGSLVTKSFDEKNVIVAGVPAKIIKKNVFWDICRKDHIEANSVSS